MSHMTEPCASAFWITGPCQSNIRRETLRQPDLGQVVVRTRYSAISRGTEALIYRGQVPPSEYQRMRAPFQAGEFPGPVKYGYINVGEVERGPDALLGQTVFCLYPHQTRFMVPAEAVSTLPQNVPAGRAVLAANLETALNGLWDLSPSIGDRISVVGAGAVGCLVAWLAGRVPGCRVELIDTNPGRAEIAARLGVGFASPDRAQADADAVVHCSGSASGLTTALGLAGFEATVLEMSWYGTQSVSLPLGEAFHASRLCLRASQVGSVAAKQRARWSHGRRMRLALELLSDPVLDCLITHESPFDTLPAVFAQLADNPGDSICHRIIYP